MELYGKVSEKRLILFGRNGATKKEKEMANLVIL